MEARAGLPVKVGQQCQLTADPWERQPSEPSACWLMFQVYLDCPQPRATAEVWRAAVAKGVAKAQRTPPGYLHAWAWRWRWAERAAAWETAQAAALAAQRQQRLERMEARGLEALEAAMERVVEGLAHPDGLDTREAIQALPKLMRALLDAKRGGPPGVQVQVQVDMGKVLAEVYGPAHAPVLDVEPEP